MTTILEFCDLRFGYGARPLFDALCLQVRAGEFVGVIGRNGVGKTTLLHLALGLQRPTSGSLRLLGSPLHEISRRDIARRIALVPQETSFVAEIATGLSVQDGICVRDIVAMGRNPHRGRFASDTAEDQKKIQAALHAAALEPLAQRSLASLSGGERQRVMIARAIAQETPLLLLDEPTANLDIAHQLEIFELLRTRCDAGVAVLAAIHDLELASRYCTRLILLSDGKIAADGPAAAVLTEATLRSHFDVHAKVSPCKTRDGLLITTLASTRFESAG